MRECEHTCIFHMYVAEIFKRTKQKSARTQYLSRATRDPTGYDSSIRVHAELRVDTPRRPQSEGAAAHAALTILLRTDVYVHVRDGSVSIQ